MLNIQKFVAWRIIFTQREREQHTQGVNTGDDDDGAWHRILALQGVRWGGSRVAGGRGRMLLGWLCLFLGFHQQGENEWDPHERLLIAKREK